MICQSTESYHLQVILKYRSSHCKYCTKANFSAHSKYWILVFFVRYRVPCLPAATESEAFRFDIAVISHTTCAAPRIATCFRRPYRHPRPRVNRFLHLHPACCLLAVRCPQPGFGKQKKAQFVSSPIVEGLSTDESRKCAFCLNN